MSWVASNKAPKELRVANSNAQRQRQTHAKFGQGNRIITMGPGSPFCLHNNSHILASAHANRFHMPNNPHRYSISSSTIAKDPAKTTPRPLSLARLAYLSPSTRPLFVQNFNFNSFKEREGERESGACFAKALVDYLESCRHVWAFVVLRVSAQGSSWSFRLVECLVAVRLAPWKLHSDTTRSGLESYD